MNSFGRDTIVCAVDIGTSAVRAGLVDSSGTFVAAVRNKRSVGPDGEFDADVLWDDLADALAKLSRHPRAKELAAIGIAGHVGTVVVDAHGEPTAPASGWSDRRGVDLLARHWDAEALHRSGRPVITGGALPYLCWLRAHRPDAHGRVRGVLSPKDYLVGRLTGEFVTDDTSAAYTLAFDVRARSWSSRAIEVSGLDAAVFPVHAPGSAVVGRLTRAAADRTGLCEGTPVVAGGPDGTVGAALCASAHPDAVVDVAGTTDAVMEVVRRPEPAAGAVLNPYLEPGSWSRGGPTGHTGGAFAYVCRLLGVREPDGAMARFGEEMVSVSPGSDGLLVVPSLAGSRYPDWRLDERAAFVGFTEAHTPAHLLRATAEAAAYLVRGGLDGLAASRPVVLAGGLARARWAVQLRADVFGRTVLACTEPDMTLLGAAALAAVGIGLYHDLDSAARGMMPPVEVHQPDRDRTVSYARLYSRWCSLRESLLTVPC